MKRPLRFWIEGSGSPHLDQFHPLVLPSQEQRCVASIMFGGGMLFTESQSAPTTATQSPEAKKPRQEEKATVLPTTCSAVAKVVAKANGDVNEIRFFGTEPAMLLLVGQTERVVQNSSNLEFVLNDSTGRLDARYYMQDLETELKSIEAGTYVAIAGQVRTAPTMHISVTALRRVQSADEISFHMIEAAHAALKLPQVSAPSTPELKRELAALNTQVSPPKDVGHAAVSAIAAPSPAIAAAAKSQHEGDALRKAVIAFVQSTGESSGEGVAIGAICTQCSSATEKCVRAVLDQLVEEGELFTTIDDDHFQAL